MLHVQDEERRRIAREPSGGNTIGVGIAGMRERIRQFGGELTVALCEPGTLVEATVPSAKESILSLRRHRVSVRHPDME